MTIIHHRQWQTSHRYTYEGYEEGVIPDSADTYMIYQEGIYVGYKYYETRYEDGVMQTGSAGDYVYGDNVAFPFGYGLCYTRLLTIATMSLSYDEANASVPCQGYRDQYR